MSGDTEQSPSDTPTFSIVVPSFNQGKYLKLCLRSIMSQHYATDKIQIIVMDGGSTDESVSIIREHESRIDYWQSKADGGQSQAINDGMKRATGQIVGWLNSDDILLPDALRQAADSLVDSRYAATSSDAFHWDVQSSGLYRTFNAAPTMTILRAFGNPVAQPTCFWRANAWRQIGGLRSDLHLMLDYELHARFVKHGYRYLHTDAPRAVIIWHGANKCATLDPSAEHQWMRQHHGLMPLSFQRTAGKVVYGGAQLLRGNIEFVKHAVGRRVLPRDVSNGLGKKVTQQQATELLEPWLLQSLSELKP